MWPWWAPLSVVIRCNRISNWMRKDIFGLLTEVTDKMQLVMAYMLPNCWDNQFTLYYVKIWSEKRISLTVTLPTGKRRKGDVEVDEFRLRFRFRRRMWINGYFWWTFGFGRKQPYHIRCTFGFGGLQLVNSVVAESRPQSLSCGDQSAPDAGSR